MSEDVPSNREVEELGERLKVRFPDFRCARCGNDRFLARVWRDSTLIPAFTDNRVLEYICDNCGLIERHLAAGLVGDLGPVKQRIRDEHGADPAV